MAFNPNEKLMSLKGKDYLEVKWRLVWFRQEHPDWGISTQIVEHSIEKRYAVVKATITDATGRVVAEGTKMEDAKGFADYLEKAETGAIGRALGILGYGTQFAPEFDEVVDGVANPRIVDAPVELKRATPPRPQVLDIKGSGVAFGAAVKHHEPDADSARIKEVFSLLTNNAERTVENLTEATKALYDVPASEYEAVLQQLEKENGNAN
jgi:hypothetical protein